MKSKVFCEKLKNSWFQLDMDESGVKGWDWPKNTLLKSEYTRLESLLGP